MEPNLAQFLEQLPYVGVTLGIVFWFVKVIREEREKCDQRAKERDVLFSQALKSNTEALHELSLSISKGN